MLILFPAAQADIVASGAKRQTIRKRSRAPKVGEALHLHCGRNWKIINPPPSCTAVSRRTITQWMADHEEFSLAVSRAKAQRLRQLETAALKGMFTQKGGNATLIIFGLKNAGRAQAGEEDEWTERSEVKYSGDPDNPIVQRIERVIVDAKDRDS